MTDAPALFRHVPGLVVYGAAGCVIDLGLAAWGLFSSDPRLSTLGIRSVVVLFGLGGFIALWGLLEASWQTHWVFMVTAERLIARDWISRASIDSEWTTIVAVLQRPAAWWGVFVRLRLNEIRLANGSSISFGTHLLGYGTFIDELRRRAVACQKFDPAPAGLFG